MLTHTHTHTYACVYVCVAISLCIYIIYIRMAHKTAALMRFSSANQAASAGAIAVASEEVQNGELRRLRRESASSGSWSSGSSWQDGHFAVRQRSTSTSATGQANDFSWRYLTSPPSAFLSLSPFHSLFLSLSGVVLRLQSSSHNFIKLLARQRP